jgi:putative DNA primase/helicase
MRCCWHSAASTTRMTGGRSREIWPGQRFAGAFSQHQERPTKTGAQAWSPTKYKPGATRGNGGVESISCAVLDIDNGTPLENVRRKLDGYAFLAHSSFSHTDEHPKYRIILPLNTASPAQNWPLHWARINHWLGHINDPATKDQARIYFMPCHPPGSQTFVEVGQGKPLDIKELPELPEGLAAPIKTAQSRSYSKVKIEGIEDPPTDLSPAVGLAETVSRCIFMRTASAPENQNLISEPLWSAMISNACCFADSEEWIHEASCHHDSYDENSTEHRIERFRNNYAPITCERIRAFGFGQCPPGGCLLPSKVATKSPAGLWTWLLKRPRYPAI